MATRKKTEPVQTVQTELIVTKPEPVTVSAPDIGALVTKYTNDILPLSSFVISNNLDYQGANALWLEVRGYCDTVEDCFKEAKSLAYRAHRSITTLESNLIAPGRQIAAHMEAEILRWRADQERIRQEEERRAQAEEAARQRELLARAKAQAEAENLRLQAIRDAEIADLAPWEIEDAPPAPVAVVPVHVPEPTPIRLASSLPFIVGAAAAKKPWAARLVDLKALVAAAAKDDTLLEFIQFNQVAGNLKARELGERLSLVVPGVEAYQDEILKRA